MGALAIEIAQRAIGADAKCAGLIRITMDAVQEIPLFTDGKKRRVYQSINQLHMRQAPSL
jgi:hypothetical protein